MCGIAGIIAFEESGKKFLERINPATSCIRSRGPDHEGFYINGQVAFGHRRLSIIDVSESANQPMSDATGRYTIIFNGEFFNFHEQKKLLEKQGVQFRTSSDTEVLLQLYIHYGVHCLDRVNGFFALAIHDQKENTIFIARDRMGIKPLFYYRDSEKLIFGSELKSLIEAGIPRVPDRISVLNYLQLNYIPGPWSIFENVSKLQPGHFLLLSLNSTQKELSETAYYSIPEQNPAAVHETSYDSAKNELANLLDDAVRLRLVSDVPLGCFLSGGIDSSVITALAARHVNKLNTFSIGFKDEPLYDETGFAQLVAKKHNTNHTVFSLTNDDLFECLYNVLDYLDEPFADSSALAVYILSKHTRKHVTVALSGDGADEMFGGYNKHRAEWVMRNNGFMRLAASVLSPVLSPFEGSRGTAAGNKIRQLHRFAEGMKLPADERYWRWCGYAGEQEIDKLIDFTYENNSYFRRKKNILTPLGNAGNLNDVFRMDMNLVLPNDMLVKVDMMSMANSLEVRVPFLDYRVVNFAFGLPEAYKITRTDSKKILRDTFRDQLPAELLNRGKHGFEVPLLNWFRTGLKSLIEELLGEDFIDRQGLFNYDEITQIRQRLFSSVPGDIEGRMWGLIVFQYWWKKYMD